MIVQGVSGDKYALGYLPFNYYVTNKKKLKALLIHWEGHGEGPVAPSEENVINGTYNPLARPLFIYVNAESAKRPEVEEFVNFYLDQAAGARQRGTLRARPRRRTSSSKSDSRSERRGRRSTANRKSA